MSRLMDATSSKLPWHQSKETVLAQRPNRSTVARAPGLSKIETLASWSESIEPTPLDILSKLLASCAVWDDLACSALHPLWADEAMRRACGFVRLLKSNNETKATSALRPHWKEYSAASRLCRTLLGLQTVQAGREQPCDQALREVASDLTCLFGTDLVRVELSTAIGRLSLPAYRRRALILLGTEMLINTFTHAFDRGGSGSLEVGLQTARPGVATLYVADDGIGIGRAVLESPSSVTCALAGLLQGRFCYRPSGIWSTFAEITFPIRAQ